MRSSVRTGQGKGQRGGGLPDGLEQGVPEAVELEDKIDVQAYLLSPPVLVSSIGRLEPSPSLLKAFWKVLGADGGLRIFVNIVRNYVLIP